MPLKHLDFLIFFVKIAVCVHHGFNMACSIAKKVPQGLQNARVCICDHYGRLYFGPKWLNNAVCVVGTQEYVRLKAYVLKLILSTYNMVM